MFILVQQWQMAVNRVLFGLETIMYLECQNLMIMQIAYLTVLVPTEESCSTTCLIIVQHILGRTNKKKVQFLGLTGLGGLCFYLIGIKYSLFTGLCLKSECVIINFSSFSETQHPTALVCGYLLLVDEYCRFFKQCNRNQYVCRRYNLSYQPLKVI